MCVHQAKINYASSLLALLAVPLTGTAARLCAQSITVTAPNGGEVWEAGTTQLITWDEVGLAFHDTVEIWLLRENELHELIGVDIVGVEELEWSICDFIGDSTEYTVRIVCTTCDPPLEDVSDEPFEITGSLPVPTLTVTAPNGGEIWPAGTTQTVTWSSTDPHGYVAAWLWWTAGRGAFVGYVPMEQGGITWDICPHIGDGSYGLVLTWFDRCGPEVEDFSDAPFTISDSLPLPTLTVTSPNGGEVWPADTTQPITWDSTDPSGEVEIWLTDAEQRYDYLGSAPTEEGRFDWPILACVGDGTEYLILVRWSACERSVEDLSDAPFGITGSADEPALTVTSPVPGEVWAAGSTQTITWDSSVVNGDVEVALFEGSLFYVQLGRVPVADGSFEWNVCPGVGDNSDYRVRVRLPDCAAEGFSDPFEITESVTPTLTLTSPVGGEAWAAGSPYDITWQSAGLAGQLDIYVPNDGWHHSGHAVVPTTDGSFTWPIAPTLEPDDYDGVWLWSYECGPVLSQIGGTFEVTECITPPADFDGDSDVDLRDFASFQTCFTGRGPVILDPICDSFDFEPDGDVDKDDFAEAVASITGP